MNGLRHEFEEKIRVNNLSIKILEETLEYYNKRIRESKEEIEKFQKANEDYQRYLDGLKVENDRF